MRFILSTCLLLVSASLWGQGTDSTELYPPVPIDKENIFLNIPGFPDPVSSYDYSGKWDLDKDGQKDSLLLVGNGGAHAWYYPRLILSSNGRQYDYPHLLIDFPYPGELSPKKIENDQLLQLAIINEPKGTYMYLKVDVETEQEVFNSYGLHQRKILFSFDKGTPVLSDFDAAKF
ncbi:MAG: hypothetical protein EP338_05500 [Bacteroidetes bacterium]|nr:MAG: hypothetical protein EP338_05500 [Bacteroidota bacterium]